MKYLRMYFWVSFILLIFVFPLNANAQEDSSKVSSSVLKNDIETFISNGVEIFTSPFNYKKEQWLTTGAVVVGTALLFSIDNAGRNMFQRNQSHIGNKLSKIGREYGREIYGITLAGGLYLGGLAFQESDVRITGLMLFESLAYIGITTTILKSSIGRSRPFYEEGSMKFRGLQFKHATTSLPSGHAAVAFTISTVLSNQIKNLYASILLYSTATLTAVSRIYHDEHWVSDVFLGSAIGYAIGSAVISYHSKEKNSPSLKIVPTNSGVSAVLIF